MSLSLSIVSENQYGAIGGGGIPDDAIVNETGQMIVDETGQYIEFGPPAP